MSVEWRYLVVVGITLWLVTAVFLEGRRKQRLARLTPLPRDVAQALFSLFQEYMEGRLNVPLLGALRRCAVKGVPIASVNLAICVEVAAGRYTEALSWRELCADSDLKGEQELLLRINEAEAMACLGRAEESLAWLNRDGSIGITTAGVACHRAWCLAILKRPSEAAAELSKVTAGQLGPDFQSEWHLADAAVAIAATRWLDADHALAKAQRLAVRASTRRNVHFSRGLLLAAQGLHSEALAHFEEGSTAIYMGQGGDALLSWGDSLAALGRTDDAKRAWALCAERDPQSPAAATALIRLKP